MPQLKNTSSLCTCYAQNGLISTNATTPSTIINGGIGSKTINATDIKVGSTISIVQTGKMTSANGTQGAITFKINSTTVLGTLASLPNSLNQGGLRAVWDITVKSIDETSMILQVAVQSGINSTTFVNVFNRIACIEMTVPVSTSYTIDLLYHFNDGTGALIEIGQTIIKKSY